MREERIAEDGARTECKEDPEKRERPFCAARGASRQNLCGDRAGRWHARRSRCSRSASWRVKIATSRLAPTLTARPHAAEWIVSGQRPHGSSCKETVKDDQSWWLGKHHEQDCRAIEADQHRAATHPRKPTKAEIGRKELSGQRQGERRKHCRDSREEGGEQHDRRVNDCERDACGKPFPARESSRAAT